jgi:hypothetical protein
MSLRVVENSRDTGGGDEIAIVRRNATIWLRVSIPSSAHAGTQEPTVSCLQICCGRKPTRRLVTQAWHWDADARCFYVLVCPLSHAESTWSWWMGTLRVAISGDHQTYETEVELRPQTWIVVGDVIFLALVIALLAVVGLGTAILDRRLDTFGRAALLLLTVLGVAETWTSFLKHVRRLYWPKLTLTALMLLLVVSSASVENTTKATLRVLGTELPPAHSLLTLRPSARREQIEAALIADNRRDDRADAAYSVELSDGFWPVVTIACAESQELAADTSDLAAKPAKIETEDCRVGPLAEAEFNSSDKTRKYRVLADAWLRGTRVAHQLLALADELEVTPKGEVATLTWTAKPEGKGLVRRVDWHANSGGVFWIPEGENRVELSRDGMLGELSCSQHSAAGVEWIIDRAYIIAGSDPQGSRDFRGLRSYDVNDSASRWIPKSPTAEAYTCLPEGKRVTSARIDLQSAPPRPFRLHMTPKRLPARLEIARPGARGILECHGTGKDVVVQPISIKSADTALPREIVYSAPERAAVAFTWIVLEGEMEPWSCRSPDATQGTIFRVQSTPHAALQYRVGQAQDVLESVPGRVCYLSRSNSQPIDEGQCGRKLRQLSPVAMSHVGATGCAAVYECDARAVAGGHGIP